MTFFHGIRVVEFGTDGATIGDIPSADYAPPGIISAAWGVVSSGQPYSIELMADEPASFALIDGDDSAAFALAGDLLTLPARAYDAKAFRFVASLSATDAAGNVTFFKHVVVVIASAAPAKAGQLDFSDPEQSALQ